MKSKLAVAGLMGISALIGVVASQGLVGTAQAQAARECMLYPTGDLASTQAGLARYVAQGWKVESGVPMDAGGAIIFCR